MARNLSSGLERLNVDILSSIGNGVVGYVDRNDAEFLRQNHAYITFLEIHERFQKALSRRKNVGLGYKVEQADRVRTVRFIALRKRLWIESVGDDSKAEAARILLQFLKNYRKRLKGHYNLKTERYKILITLLSNNYFAPNVAEVGVEHLIDALQQSNDAFAELRSKQRSGRALLNTQPTATSLVPEYASAIRNLILFAEIMAGDPQWSDYHGYLSESLRSAHLSASLSAAHRARRRKKKEEEEEEAKNQSENRPPDAQPPAPEQL